jgi:hypothetical protein
MFLLFFFIFYEMCDENTYRQRRINRQPDFRGGLKTIAWFSFFCPCQPPFMEANKKRYQQVVNKSPFINNLLISFLHWIYHLFKIQGQLPIAQQVKGSTMIRTCPMQGNCRPVLFGRIPLVAPPVVHRIFRIQALHIIITIRFCQYGSSRNRQELGISLDHHRMRYARIRIEAVSVNQQVLRTNLQLVYGPVHG